MTKTKAAAEVDYSSGPSFKPNKAAAAALRSIGPVELAAEDATPKPKRLSWNDLNERDYSRLELAADARAALMSERTAKRLQAARKFRREAVRHSAEFMRSELTPVQLAEAARAAGVSAEVEYARQLAEAAEALGVSEAEAADMLAAERSLVEPSEAEAKAAGVELAGPVSEAAREAAKAAREAAKAARLAFADMRNSEAAKAAREALAAIGPRAAALVVTTAGAQSVTVAKVQTIPPLAEAVRRAEAAREALAAGRETLAAAEAKAAAAAKAKAVRPIREAEAEADRVAAGVAKLAKRAAAAEAAEAEALKLAARPEAENLIWVPVESFPLAEAAEAAALELRQRADVMPARFRDNGPAAKAARPVSDPTGDSAAALADGYRAALAEVERKAAELAAKTSREAAAEAAAVTIEARRVEYKARRAEAARKRRAEAAAARSMGEHGKQRAAKRAAR